MGAPENFRHSYHIFRVGYDCRYTMIMMAKPMKAQTESTDPVLNNTDYIGKLKKTTLMRQIQASY